MATKLYLVDSSAWIISFKMKGFLPFKKELKKLIMDGIIHTNQLIILELLQGTKSNSEKEKLRSYLEALNKVDINHKTWEKAYDIAYQLRRNGITVPIVDVIIASLAIESNCILIHYDKHFSMIAKKFSKLQIISVEDF